jgi:transcriptional regulator with XRE-family HTH domain
MNMSVFAEKIRRLRTRHNLTTRMMGEIVGVSCGQISKYENDKTEPTLSVLKGYAQYFGVTLDYLCNDDEE